MSKKTTIITILLVLILAVGSILYFSQNKGTTGSNNSSLSLSPQTKPDYIVAKTSPLKLAQPTDLIKTANEDPTGPKTTSMSSAITIPNPNKSNSLQYVQSASLGNTLKLTKENLVIPVKNVLESQWIDETKLIITQGSIKNVGDGKNVKLKISGEKGIYIYNIESQELNLIYSVNADVDSFSAKRVADNIVVCTGQNLEKLDLNGTWQRTIYTNTEPDSTIFLTGQIDTPKNKVEIGFTVGSQKYKLVEL
ncbi:MAG: hypothetical protein WCK98_05730 [bacterium]